MKKGFITITQVNFFELFFAALLSMIFFIIYLTFHTVIYSIDEKILLVFPLILIFICFIRKDLIFKRYKVKAIEI